MLIPSIDIQDGSVVQLIEGESLAHTSDKSPQEIASNFELAGEIAVVDIDAAKGEGNNTDLIRDMLDIVPCRVGGGIRSAEEARQWLEWGAEKVVIGSAAEPELLQKLPSDRVIVALDHRDGEVVTNGWTTREGERVVERLSRLYPHAHQFLVTSVEDEGHMTGTDYSMARDLGAVSDRMDISVTIAGGIAKPDTIKNVSSHGHDVQIGRALECYGGRLTLSEAMWGVGQGREHQKIVPTVVCDSKDRALGLVYSDFESFDHTIDTGFAHYHSRDTGLWKKGEESGHVQHILDIRWDCDRDALRFRTRTKGETFCHLDQTSCWGEQHGYRDLESIVKSRLSDKDASESYTAQIAENGLDEKIQEEAQELAEASSTQDILHEANDLLYFLTVKCQIADIDRADLLRVLRNRHQIKSHDTGD
jgi:phosphoribosyl-ATP pyrophosphohydrolase